MKKNICVVAALVYKLALVAQMDQTTAISTMNTTIIASADINSVSPSKEGTDHINTPEVVTGSFERDFPNTIAIWHKEGKNYKVWYTDSLTKLRKSLVYDKNGVVVGQNNELDYSEIPYGIIYYYPANTKKDKYHVWESLTQQGEKVYVSKMDGKTDYFDPNGTHLAVKPQLKQNVSGKTVR